MTYDIRSDGVIATTGHEAYVAKPAQYFHGVRRDYVDALPDAPAASILEVGCSHGGTGALAIAQGKCARYVGIEIHEPSAAIARERLSEVLVGDVETMPLPFEPRTFDALIMSEVLEHLGDPWSALARLTALVRPGGMVMASSPNVSHISVVRGLIRGRWDLADKGLMDRTHLRWFTPRSFRAMFEGAGVEVDDIRDLRRPGRKARLVNRLTGGRYAHLFMYQISLHGRMRPQA